MTLPNSTVKSFVKCNFCGQQHVKKKGKFVKSFLNFYVSKLPNKLYSYRIKKNFQLPIRNIVLGLLSLKNTTKFKWENLVGFLYFFNLKMKKKCQA